MTVEWILSETVASAEEAAAQFIAAQLTTAVHERGLATFAISGGSTPWGMFEKLAAQDAPWDAVHLFQVDERIAPPDHAARNWKRLLETTLAQRIAPARRHAMPVELEDADRAAEQYAKILSEWAGTPPQFDIVHLGIGADGHTASLFVDDPLLEEQRRWVGVSHCYQNYRRLSLTLPALNHARCIVWFAVGAAVRPALTRLYARDTAIAAAWVEPDRAICFTDPAAAPAL